ncbi:hypothetical protein P781_02095 [Vibrio mimicus CAIM 1883]|nr:hypothetical protein P781_02095 [Vibrio mimicus CAIM 1883]ERM62984.1 hypothetical protein P780_02080 [Vibrio mimicus CAIM 1882]
MIAPFLFTDSYHTDWFCLFEELRIIIDNEFIK